MDPVSLEAWTARRTGLGEALDSASLALWQGARLRETLAWARRSRHYRERLAGVDPSSIRTPADLAALPFTWPGEVAEDPAAFLCVSGRDVARVATLPTSGRTGARKRIFFSERDLEGTVAFLAMGMGTLVDPGRATLILLPEGGPHSIARLLAEALARLGVPARLRGEGGAREALEAARDAGCLVGSPAEVLYLARLDPSLRPASVLLSGEHAPSGLVRAVEEAWRTRVHTHYGLTEGGYGCAVQCACREGHHLRDADLVFEIVDPESGVPLEPGARGEIVLTTLGREAMPLVRYRTGDVSCLLTDPCGCGGVLPRLGFVEGRQAPRTAGLSLDRLDEVLFPLTGLRGFEAALGREDGEPLLDLRLDAPELPSTGALAAALPWPHRLRVAAGLADPFRLRGKRTLQGAT
jgi:phenylacetate-coenzyme A ligase PaaK-like adenylate-forming protein